MIFIVKDSKEPKESQKEELLVRGHTGEKSLLELPRLCRQLKTIKVKRENILFTVFFLDFE